MYWVSDPPLNFHLGGTGVLWVDTPTGAGGATDRCAELSVGAARLSVAVSRSSANAFGAKQPAHSGHINGLAGEKL